MKAETKRRCVIAPTLVCALASLAACSRRPITGDAGRGGVDVGFDVRADRSNLADAALVEAGAVADTAASIDADPDALPVDASVDLRPDAGPVDAACTTVSVLPAVQSLFTPADAKNPPVFYKRDDGVIVTRAAARFRGRHEKEGSFGQYLEYTFIDRTYGVTIEDFTPLGQQRLRVTFLPIFKPTMIGNRVTNFRQWKLSGNNASFALNDFMPDVPAPTVPPTAPFGGVQQYDNVMRAPEGRSITAGETYEFEFGIFMPSGSGLRDSYYTDTFRYRIGQGGLTPNNRDYEPLAGPLPAAQLGGDTTVAWLVAEPFMYFEQMALNIQHENVQPFMEGRRLFSTDFTTGAYVDPGNPPFPEQAGKAGPLFNAESCRACHFRNGYGSLVDGPLGGKASFEIKLIGGGALGDQLQAQEGTVTSTLMNAKTVVLSDGTSVVLRRPSTTVTANGRAVARFSARIARPLMGLGLLEALDEGAILALATGLDCDKDVVSGRPSLVRDPATGALRLGRFGWKAEKVSVAHQVAAEASASLGVTTTLFPDAQGKAELSDADLAKLTTYMRLVGVAPQRLGENPQVIAGAGVFAKLGCAACHRRELTTSANHPFAELRAQTIHPYTDLLLHDMGPDLADDSGVALATAVDSPASSTEWRTPPLWGVGLAATVNRDATFLHDGRAANVQEAILWHGGEALRSREAYVGLGVGEREALLAFLGSL